MPTATERYDIQGDLEQSIQSRIAQNPIRSNWPSQIGHPCLRYLTLIRLHWDKLSKHEAGLQAIFDGGREAIEPFAKYLLEGAGYKLYKNPQNYRIREANISGKVDYFITKTDEKDAIPIEVKGLAPGSYNVLKVPQDFLEHEKVYIRGYYSQIQLYIHAAKTDWGAFLLINKLNYWPRIIEIERDQRHIDELIDKGKAIEDHLLNRTIPDRIPPDASVCGQCKCMQICYPGQELELVFPRMEDEELLNKLERREELTGAHSEWVKVDKQVSEAVKNQEMQVGDFLISGKVVKSTVYDVPQEVKDKYKTIRESWRKRIQRIETT